MPPDHEVRVGAQPGHVVACRGRRRPLPPAARAAARSRRSARSGPPAAEYSHAEYRPHRVADHRVEVACLRSGRTVVGHESFSAHRRHCPASRRCRRTRRAADSAPAMHAGIPTPSYAAPHTARPGAASSAVSTRETRALCPTAYCGSAPPQRVTRESTGLSAAPVASLNSSATAAPGRRHRAASPLPRRSGRLEQRTSTMSGDGCVYPSPTLSEEYVVALISRRSTAGRGNRCRGAAPRR